MQETTLTLFTHNLANKKKLNFLSLPDLAFGFVNKRSGYEITLTFWLPGATSCSY